MSLVVLDQAKRDLRIIHDDDDDILQVYIDGAENEALQYLDMASFDVLLDQISDGTSSEPQLPPSVRIAILLLVRSKYEVATPDQITAFRTAAETLLQPFRTGIGL